MIRSYYFQHVLEKILSSYLLAKITRIMKLSFIILVLSVEVVLASHSYAQDAMLSLDIYKKPVVEVLDEIEKQSGLHFYYNSKLVNTQRKVTINVKDENVFAILNQIFSESNTDYKVLNNDVILVEKDANSPLAAMLKQGIVATGKVIDSNGEPIPGVNVVIRGTSTGTVTDVNGKYSINVPNRDAVLVFSFIGFVTQEILLGDKNQVDITLVEDTQQIEEVVVIGYGTARKSDVTGAIASVQNDVIKEVPAADVSQALIGRIAGVNIQQAGFRPGAETTIRIRGTRSLSASNDPLIVLDGIPFAGSINEIAPDDVKSIDILKDASATAIYGSRGANGVILITTNRGESSIRPSVSYSGYFGLNTVAKKYEMMSPEDFVTMRLRSGYQSSAPWLPQEQQYFTTGKSYDWQDEMYQTGIVTNHDLSIKAGNQTLQGSVGFNYYNETSTLPGQEFRRFSIRGNLDFKVNNWFKLGLNTQESLNFTNGESVNQVVMGDLLQFSPLVNPYDEDGKVIVAPLTPREDIYSPLLIKDNSLWAEERRRFSAMNSIYAEIQFMPELKYRLNLGLNYSQQQYGTFYSQKSNQRSGQKSTASVNELMFYNYSVDNLLYYDKEFLNKHRISATAMFSFEDRYNESVGGSGQDMTADYMQYHNMNMANSNLAMTGSYSRRTLISYMGRFNYTYDGKYMITVTGRSDGASVLAEGNKWHFYPAISGAWNIRRESFMENAKMIDLLKLRMGYGQTSNESVSPYSTLGMLSTSKYNFGDEDLFGFYTSGLGNPSLGWEYTHSYNIGIDFSFWNRLSGTIDMYLQKTYDLLVVQKLPASSGASNFTSNVGETENKGIEVTLHSENIVPKLKGGFGWSTDLNMYRNRNKLISLQSGVDRDEGNGWFVGHPIDVIFDYKKLGIWQSNEAAEAAVYGLVPGDIKLADLDGSRSITEADRSIIHTFEPDFTFGLTNRLQYKNFDLTIIMHGQVGGTLVSTLHQNSFLNMLHGRYNQLNVDYWHEDNPTNDHPRAFNSGGMRPYWSTLGYFDASFLKIRTMTLGYSLPNRWLNRIGINGLRVYVTCNNVATLFSPYMKKGGLDPQPTGGGTQTVRGNTGGGSTVQGRQMSVALGTPPTRQFLFGVNIKL